MFSPFEELEQLADYLPEEGESVLITREEGELVCKPFPGDDLREGIDEAELYGFLVQANEKLHAVGAYPIWITVIGLTWLAIVMYGILGISWERWYLLPGLAIPVVLGTVNWIQQRQRRLFRIEVAPQLNRELTRRGIRDHALLAGVRQHGELRTLFDELVRWSPARPSVSRERGHL